MSRFQCPKGGTHNWGNTIRTKKDDIIYCTRICTKCGETENWTEHT